LPETNAPLFDNAVPILRIFSVEKTREFYVGFLGFSVDWEHRFDEAAPLYMQISRGGLRLHLSEHHGDGTPGTAIRIEMSGIEVYHREIMAKGYGHMRPGLETTPWDTREMKVIDPFGNQLRFAEELPQQAR
jgi:uncharacterized glyoxalase superfamily protein PhnB